MHGTETADRERVWLVDDSPMQSEISSRTLSATYDVRVFDDGSSLLEALNAELVPKFPHVLVLDWHMPNLSGLDICRFVRQTRDAGELPILILTATGSADNLVEALVAGANDFLMKPCSAAELSARVAALVRNSHLHARLLETEKRLRVEGEFREGFIGMLAHDLRQPLNAFLLANNELTKAAHSSETLTPFLDLQRRAAERMSRMVAQLLDLTRSQPETGMPIERQVMDFGTLVRSVVDEMRVGHPSRTLNLIVHGDCSGQWDHDRLAQICSNLIGNAIEHSPASSLVDISLMRRDDQVEFAVSNAGERIPETLLPTLFERFRRGRGVTRRSGGVGLGLHIVAEIVRAHGGTVNARSSDTTVFSVKLPVTDGGARVNALKSATDHSTKKFS